MIKVILITFLFIFNITTVFAKTDDLSSLFDLDTPKSEVIEQKIPFNMFCSKDKNNLACTLDILDNSYVYADSIILKKSNNKAIIVNNNKSLEHTDISGTHNIFTEPFTFIVKLIDVKKDSDIEIEYQGCDSKGICYPVQSYKYHITKNIKSDEIVDFESGNHYQNSSIFNGYDNFIVILLLCLVFGMALNLTPCVLPMLSIYSATILGGKFVSLSHSIKRNLFYILGLSLTYAILGLIFSNIGLAAHSFLQHPISVAIMSLILIIFALDCMGVISVKLPTKFNLKVENKINAQQSGSFKKAFVFGALSALISTPCTSAPLAGALIYVMNTNSIFKGTIMFLMIGLGMGIPLFLIGIFGSKYLKKLKSSTNIIHKLFAIPLIIASYFISKHLYGDFTPYIESIVYAFCVTYFIYLLVNNKNKILSYVTCIVVFAITYLVNLNYNNEVLNLPFEKVTSLNDIDSLQNDNLIISVSANWCTNCHQLDKDLFSKDDFKKFSNGFRLLRVDFTDPNSKDNIEIAKRYNLIGVPSLIFIKKGEVKDILVGSIKLQDIKNVDKRHF